MIDEVRAPRLAVNQQLELIEVLSLVSSMFTASQEAKAELSPLRTVLRIPT